MSDIQTLLNLACIKHTGKSLPKSSQSFSNWKFKCDPETGKKTAVWSPSPYCDPLREHSPHEDPEQRIAGQQVIDELNYIFKGAAKDKRQIAMAIGAWFVIGLAKKRVIALSKEEGRESYDERYVKYLTDIAEEGVWSRLIEWWDDYIQEIKSRGENNTERLFQTILTECGFRGVLQGYTFNPHQNLTNRSWEEKQGERILKTDRDDCPDRYKTYHHNLHIFFSGKNKSEIWFSPYLNRVHQILRAIRLSFKLNPINHHKSFAIWEKFFQHPDSKVDYVGQNNNWRHAVSAAHGIPRKHLDEFLAQQKVRKQIAEARDRNERDKEITFRKALTKNADIPKTKIGVKAYFEIVKLFQNNSLVLQYGVNIPEVGNIVFENSSALHRREPNHYAPYTEAQHHKYCSEIWDWRHTDGALTPEELVRIFAPNKAQEKEQIKKKLETYFPTN